MTRFCYRKYYDGHLLIAEGHSGFGTKGNDIVCAAVSALIFTLINCLKNEEADGSVKLKREIVRDGYFCVEAHPHGGNEERIDTVFQTILTGLYMTADEYPEYVKFE